MISRTVERKPVLQLLLPVRATTSGTDNAETEQQNMLHLVTATIQQHVLLLLYFDYDDHGRETTKAVVGVVPVVVHP